MDVVRTRMWIAAGLLWACASAQALPLDPIDWVGRRTGAEVCCGFNSTQTFHYNSATDLFTYSHVAALRVDEPSTVALALLGLGLLVALRRGQRLLPAPQGR